MLALLGSIKVHAYDDTYINGIYYNFSWYEATVTHGADVNYNSNSYAGNIVIPQSVSYNGVTYRVTSIDMWAFLYCDRLMSVTIPNSVTSIGNEAFKQCDRLMSVTIPNSVTSIGSGAFWFCEGLTSITIPNSVTSIGAHTFMCCSGLTSITIPNTVTSIADDAFAGCSGLTDIYVDSGNSKYDSRNNCNAIIETASNTLIVGCQNTTIPNSVTSIGDCAFYFCHGLMSVTIPSSVTSIGNYTFYNCDGLTNITIPNSVTSIGNEAFNYCNGLTSITIPSSVTSIGEYPFSKCSSLTSLSVDRGNSKYDSRNNCNAIIETTSNTLIAGCQNTTIPNSVTSIGDYAFYYCDGLMSVTIPNSVTSIGKYAFCGCSNLTNVKVDLETPLSISSTTFSRSNATLYVPAGSKSAYQNASYWSQFKYIIEFIDGDVNSDGETDVLDVVDIARYVVGTPAESFVPILADINNSGEVNIADAVCLVNEIAGDQDFSRAMHAPNRVTAGEETLALSANGENGLSLALQNMREYTAFQFDLYVPEGADVTRMLLNAQRKQKHQLLYNKVEEGHWRIAALSTSNRTFLGSDGELLAITLDALTGEEIAIRNILFFDAAGNSYQFDDLYLSGTTMIQSMNNEHWTMDNSSTVYDLQGRKIVNGKSSNHQLSKGIYIVDGKKVLVK